MCPDPSGFPDMRNIVFLCFLLLSSQALALKTNQGTWTVGGQLVIPYTHNVKGASHINFREEPQASYFVADRIRLVASVEFEALLRWSTDYPLTLGLNTWGGKIGADYVWPVSSKLSLVSGVRCGVRAQNALFEYAHGLFELPFGIWYELNENAALTFALPIEFAFSRQFGFESVSVTPGYFGVTAFF